MVDISTPNLIRPRQFGIVGVMTAVLIKPNGETMTRVAHNLITNAGFDFICDVIGNSTQPAEMSHIAVGTGTTAAAAGDTALETELDRNAATYMHSGGTKIFELSATFTPGEATGAITEAGVLNAASAGTLLDRVVFSVINKAAGDSLTQKFTFTLS